MSKAACRCKSAECEECPEWIFTFADLVMLMMGFFVILWVLKPAPGKTESAKSDDDWLKVAAAVREYFNYIPDPQSKDPVDLKILMKKLEHIQPLKGPGEGGKTKVPPNGPQGTDPEVTSVRPGKQSLVGGRVLFAAGSADLPPDANATLGPIASLIRGHRNIVLVKGHAALDDFPDGAEAGRRMDLSLRRAQGVADFLTAHGVEPDMLRVQGCSTFEPVVERAYTAEARSRNRRAEVESTANLIVDRQDAAGRAAAPTLLPTNSTAEGSSRVPPSVRATAD